MNGGEMQSAKKRNCISLDSDRKTRPWASVMLQPWASFALKSTPESFFVDWDERLDPAKHIFFKKPPKAVSFTKIISKYECCEVGS